MWRRWQTIVDAALTPDFQHSVSVAVTVAVAVVEAVAVAVSVKTVFVQAVYAVASGACARQQRGRPKSQGAEFPRAKEWA